VSRVTRLEATQMPGIKVLNAKRFPDERGWLIQSWVKADLEAAHIPATFKQAIQTVSRKGVVRGLHFQWDPPMGKLMRVSLGTAFLVAVDIRKGSPTLGKWVGVLASPENRRQVWAPAGFARGFCVVSEFAEIQYKCTGIYNAKAESGILWKDDAIGIDWPVQDGDAQLSDKDKNAQTLARWLASPESEKFRYDS
jgi:dTDP-4-dehydrorhamnose 3,5-epimerase